MSAASRSRDPVSATCPSVPTSASAACEAAWPHTASYDLCSSPSLEQQARGGKSPPSWKHSQGGFEPRAPLQTAAGVAGAEWGSRLGATFPLPCVCTHS